MNADSVPPGTPPPSPPPAPQPGPQPGPQPSGPGRLSYDSRLSAYEKQRGILGRGSDEVRESRLTPKQRRRLDKKLTAETKQMFLAPDPGPNPHPQPQPVPGNPAPGRAA